MASAGTGWEHEAETVEYWVVDDGARIRRTCFNVGSLEDEALS